jgi:hypothetical protein
MTYKCLSHLVSIKNDSMFEPKYAIAIKVLQHSNSFNVTMLVNNAFNCILFSCLVQCFIFSIAKNF